MISRALERGEWRRIYPGVFLVNQASLTWKARLMGAILWAGVTIPSLSSEIRTGMLS